MPVRGSTHPADAGPQLPVKPDVVSRVPAAAFRAALLPLGGRETLPPEGAEATLGTRGVDVTDTVVGRSVLRLLVVCYAGTGADARLREETIECNV